MASRSPAYRVWLAVLAVAVVAALAWWIASFGVVDSI